MRLRSHQLACILLLLSTCHFAGATALPAGDYGIRGRYVGLLLCRDCPGGAHAGAHLGACSQWTPVGVRLGGGLQRNLPASGLAIVRTAWAMKAPAAHCMAIYSNTGSEDQNGCTLDAIAPVEVRLMPDSAGSQGAS